MDGKIGFEDIDINTLSIPIGEPDKRYKTIYTFFDVNGDGIPELYINSGGSFIIFTVRNNELAVWKYLTPNSPCFALDNGAFMWQKFGGGLLHDYYGYVIYDYFGNEVFKLGFSRYDINENGFYDEDDIYEFEGVKVTKEIWESLTERYICTDENGVERFHNEIEWIVLFEAR